MQQPAQKISGRVKRFWILIALVSFSFNCRALNGTLLSADSLPAENSVAGNNPRMAIVTGSHLAVVTGSLLLLNQMWYSAYPRSSFHFHNDLHDWFQMDKAGHAFSGYQLSRLSSSSFSWAGLPNGQSAMWGTISGNLFLSVIEILDGHSQQWGASWSDAGANLAGSLLFFGQQKLWREQKINMKFSFSPSGLASYRPELLGNNLAERIIKDYNGHTFWLSFNLNTLTGNRVFFPQWLNLAAGYGATGMLGSRTNPMYHNEVLLPEFVRYRQFYLAPDIDFSRINTHSELLNAILSTLNFLKLPAPALEYNPVSGFHFHLIFF
jgi:hypothetical protein